MEISVKNIGVHTDQVTVKGNGSATIDGSDSINLTRHVGQTFIATGGNWVIKGNKMINEHLLDVNPNSSWTNIQEVVDFLGAHMTAPGCKPLGTKLMNNRNRLIIDLPLPPYYSGCFLWSCHYCCCNRPCWHTHVQVFVCMLFQNAEF
ncbi:MAG: hypothetical protein IPP43_01925 [Chitinophagaceae bacterium]|nr:hypothetical protein [Chitinophagaceae bacterium]